MMYSTEKNFSFFHVPKTAGGSMTVLLSKYSDKDNKNKIKNRYVKGWMTPYHVRSHTRGVFNHMHSFVDPHFYKWNCQKTFSFAFVRNPYDRVVSLKEFLPKHESKSFLQFCKILEKGDQDVPGRNLTEELTPSFPPPHKDIRRKINRKDIQHTQFDCLSVNNTIPLNFVGRFENIKEDFNYICEKIGVDEKYNSLGFEHSNREKNNKNYRDYYCAESKAIIDKVFDIDFKTFNYEKEL